MGLRDQVQMVSLSPSIIIIKKAWRLIRNEILNMVNGIFRLGKLLKGVNISYVAQLPKTKSLNGFSNQRPISLVHGLYKIIAKLLSTRLKLVIPQMINANQKAFITKRRILDGFIITNEMVYKVKKKGRHGRTFFFYLLYVLSVICQKRKKENEFFYY